MPSADADLFCVTVICALITTAMIAKLKDATTTQNSGHPAVVVTNDVAVAPVAAVAATAVSRLVQLAMVALSGGGVDYVNASAVVAPATTSAAATKMRATSLSATS